MARFTQCGKDQTKWLGSYKLARFKQCGLKENCKENLHISETQIILKFNYRSTTWIHKKC